MIENWAPSRVEDNWWRKKLTKEFTNHHNQRIQMMDFDIFYISGRFAVYFWILIHLVWKDWCRAKLSCQQTVSVITNLFCHFTWNDRVLPFCFMFFFFSPKVTWMTSHVREPINFVVLRFFDVLPSRHLCRLTLNPCYTSSLLFLLPLDPSPHSGAALPSLNKC